MPLDDLGEAIAGGAAEGMAEGLADGMASSFPIPPDPPGGPPLPPPPGYRGGEEREPSPSGEPERRATVPLALVLVLTLLVGAGAFVLVTWARGGSGCEEGDFESPRFGYCVRTPGGWTAEAAAEDGPPLDRFLMPGGSATITVTAVRLSRGQDLARFEQFVRAYDERAGATLGASTSTEVAGAPAVVFDLSVETPDGVTMGREVLFARDDVAWRVQLADEEAGMDASVARLEEMLGTWRFT
jgi:hypothetical protein